MSDPAGAAVVVLWTVTREQWDDPTLARARRLVPEHLLERMPAFRRWQDVQMGLVGKLLLCRGLDQLGIDRAVLQQMSWSDSGRPSLPIDGDFNLTHSDGLVACAIGDRGPLGIDVEPMARFPASDLDQVLTENERAEIQGAADPAAEWCRIWTFKEAVIKADGRGVAVGLDRIDSHRAEVRLDSATWHVQPLALHAEFCCHLASQQPPRDPEVREILLDTLLDRLDIVLAPSMAFDTSCSPDTVDRPIPRASGTSDQGIQLYLDLLKRTLTNYVYGDLEMIPAMPQKPLKKWLVKQLRAKGFEVMRPHPFDPELRAIGRDLSLGAHSMIGFRRLDNLQHCMETAIQDEVPGDFIETGVWRGGATIFMRAVLEAYGIRDRVVWVADSFEGLPAPDATKYPADQGDKFHTYEYLRVSLPTVKRNFERYGLLDDQVQFLEGWFKDTLPGAPIDKLAVLRLDGDMYESTMDALTALYPKLSPGGFLIIDDYEAFPSCKKAIHDYREQHAIAEEIQVIDWTGAFWRRSA